LPDADRDGPIGYAGEARELHPAAETDRCDTDLPLPVITSRIAVSTRSSFRRSASAGRARTLSISRPRSNARTSSLLPRSLPTTPSAGGAEHSVNAVEGQPLTARLDAVRDRSGHALRHPNTRRGLPLVRPPPEQISDATRMWGSPGVTRPPGAPRMTRVMTTSERHYSSSRRTS